MAAINFQISANTTNVEVDAEKHVETVTIEVDGNPNNGSFYLVHPYVKWCNIQRRGNKVVLVIEKNYTPVDRNTHFMAVHNHDKTQYVDVEIVQKGIEYKIDAVDEINGLPIFEEKEERRKVDVKGGRELYYIKKIEQFTGGQVTLADGNKYEEETDYDGGLIVTIDKDTKELVVKSLGRTFVDEKNYYKITLVHSDDRFLTKEIKVIYENAERKNIIPKTIYFDNLGKLKNEGETNVFDISFGNKCPDYGYNYKFADDNKPEWLTIIECPTSLIVNVEANGGAARTAEIEVFSVDDDTNKATFIVEQDKNDSKLVPNEGYVFGLNYDTVSKTKKLDVVFRVYGKEEERNLTLNGTTHVTVNTDAITIMKGKLCDTYSAIITARTDETNGYLETLTVTSGGGNSQIIVEQKSEEASEDPISVTSTAKSGVTEATMTATTSPNENSSIIVSVSAKWCDVAINGQTFTLTCQGNVWNTTRKCKITVMNAENSGGSVSAILTQLESTNGQPNTKFDLTTFS